MEDRRINEENLRRLRPKLFGLAPKMITRYEANILDILVEEKLMELIRTKNINSSRSSSADGSVL